MSHAWMQADLTVTCGVANGGIQCQEPTAATWVMTCRCGLHGSQYLRLCSKHLVEAENGHWSDAQCAYCESPTTPAPHWCPVDVMPDSDDNP